MVKNSVFSFCKDIFFDSYIPRRGVIYHVPLSNKLACFWDFWNVINHAPTGKQ